MLINFKNTLIKNKPNYKYPSRAQIYVGFQCHQKCGFCYYKYKCNEPMFSLEFIKKEIDFLLEYGIKDIEITGGEPSEHLQLRDICKYIKYKSPKTKIAIITNGGLFSSNVWDLIDEVLISYHISKNDINIDKNFFPLGSTYNKAYKTILKARENNVLIRTNTTLGTFNLNGLDYIIDDLIDFKPTIINFLPVNIFDQAINMDDFIDYDLLRQKIKLAIDKIKYALPNTLIFVRYMPFCDMDGYEQYIVGNLQHIYDWFDWCRELDGPNYLTFLQELNINDTLRKFKPLHYDSIDYALYTQKTLYTKTAKCLKCKFQIICDGVENIHANKLIKFVRSSPGKIITNFMEYMKNKTELAYNSLYS